MGKYQGYPEYKETHLEWLREIPSHWEIKRLKYLGEAIIGLTYSPDDVVDSEDEGTLVLRSSNVQNRALAFDDNVFVNKPIPEHLKTRKGDILICARNGSRALIGKNAQIDERAEGMTFGAFMSVFRSPYNDYLSKVFNSALFEYQSGTFLTATINQLTTANLNSFEVPLPPKSERQTIANFLDHETAKIDTLIERQQQLIKLLREKRQAVISHAVTKGLNPQAPMKDSGVEWLGEVPEHWGVLRLKHLIESLESGVSVNAADIPARTDEVGVLKTSCVYTRTFRAEENKTVVPEDVHRVKCPVRKGAIIISRMNTPELVGASALVNEDVSNVYLPDRLWQTNFNQKVDLDSEYLAHFMTVEGFRVQISLAAEGASSSMQNIAKEDYLSINCLLPPLSEQQQIVQYIRQRLEYFSKLDSNANDAVNLLKERRTALISAAVTGKIDVRDWKKEN